MTLSRLSSSSILAAAALLLLGACTGPVVLAGSGGGATTTVTTTGTGGTGTGGQTTGNACAAAGGTCEALTPGACLGAMAADPAQYPCGAGVGSICCLPCGPTCPTAGATRCSGGAMETCTDKGTCKSWVATAACPSGESCNSDGTKCVGAATQCTTPADCGCGCTCTPQNVCGFCTGAIPPTCAKDADCGPDCAGFRCVTGKCQQAPCVPGQDQSCNENLAMSSFAGTCNPDRTCTCKAGFSLKASGKCG